MGSWHQLDDGLSGGDIPFARSSHTLVPLSGGRMALFGGEHAPRHPVDLLASNDNQVTVHLLQLNKAEGACRYKWTHIRRGTQHGAPLPRMGHGAAGRGDRMYVFGGRTGVDQSATSLGDLWEFNTSSGTWRQIQSEGAPEARSYHAMTALGKDVFVFGGCGKNGRLNDLHVFDTEAEKWKKLHGISGDAPCPRGGPALFAVSDKLYVFGGFCGKELGDLYCFDLHQQSWSHIEGKGDVPSPRSVALACTLDANRLFLFGGEIEASQQGHEGAGAYSNETFIFSTDSLSWTKIVPQEPNQSLSGRGWLAGERIDTEGIGPAIVLFGGFDGERRLNDIHLWY